MSRIKLLLNVVNDIRSLADSLEAIANEMVDGDNSTIINETPLKGAELTHEIIRGLAVELSRKGHRDEIKQLIEKYGVKNITAVSEEDFEAFYADLKAMEVS